MQNPRLVLLLTPILALCGCGADDNGIHGTYDVLYTPVAVSVSFPEESPVGGPDRDSFRSHIKVPCDQEHMALDPPYEMVDPVSFADVLEVSLDGESMSVTDGHGNSYSGPLVGTRSELVASVVLPDTAADAAVPEMGLYPETTGTARFEIEFDSDGFEGTMEYTLDIDASGIILADCNSSYDAKGTKR